MKMRFIPGVVLVSGWLLYAPAAEAQSPVAVPIVGSEAARQPPSQPPTVQPPAVPQAPPQTGAVFTPPSVPPPPAAAPPQVGAARGPRKLDLTFKDGTVGLDAQNVTLREILTEWQRRGGCQFVNADKLTGGPVTRQFPPGTPELQAIDSLLRDLAAPNAGYGYMIGPPATERAQNQSFCGAVYILPMSRPTASAASFMPSAGAPMAAPLVTPGSPDDEIPPVQAFPPPMPPRPNPMVPGQPDPGTPNTPPPPPNAGFGPIAPTAQAPGRPATPPPGGAGRGNPAP